MKHRIILLLLLVLSLSSHAQWSDYGVSFALGRASIVDDLSTRSGILAANLGFYSTYRLGQSESILAEIFSLQTGLNLIRRGNNFEEVLAQSNSMMHRTGYNHAYYLQLPVLAQIHYELPIRQAGHNIGVFLGPAVSYGLFGKYQDRKVTPGVSAQTENYDLSKDGTSSDKQVFNHLNRIDFSILLGLQYNYKDLSVSLFIDHGFLPTSDGEDILRLIESNQSSSSTKVKIPNGNNNALLLSVAYRLGSF